MARDIDDEGGRGPSGGPNGGQSAGPDEEASCDPAEIRNRALDLLVRREHTRFELLGKLTRRGFDSAACEAVLDALVEENALSDERFAELYVHYRRERGFGPLRIRDELRKRGVSDVLRDEWCPSADEDWNARALALRSRRFGAAPPAEYRERARQARFLTQRGFTGAQVSAAFAEPES